jgi:PKD repeat protein
MSITKNIFSIALTALVAFSFMSPVEAGKKPKGPTAVLNGPWGAEPGEVITFSGQGSSSPNGFIRQYCFNFGDQSPIVCDISFTATHAYTYQGEYTVTLTVTDPAGEQATTADTAIIQYDIPGQTVDLTVTAIDGPRSGRRGDHFPITVSIENLDWAVATGTFRIAIYLSEDNVITTDDEWKMTIYVTNFPGKASRTYETAILLSGDLPLGDYYFGAIVDQLNVIDESDETNNALSSTDTMTIRPQKKFH